MVDDICTMEVLSLWEERISFTDRYREMLVNLMCNALADLISERAEEFLKIDIHRQLGYIDWDDPPEEWKADLVYKMQLAVLTPQRYKELLKAERELLGIKYGKRRTASK